MPGELPGNIERERRRERMVMVGEG